VTANARLMDTPADHARATELLLRELLANKLADDGQAARRLVSPVP
jgi:hypothetical protein